MKDNELDNLFRNALSEMDGVPPQAKNWDGETVFDRIQNGLNGENTSNRRSFFDLAAAIVVTLTALTYMLSFFVKTTLDETLKEATAMLHETPLLENPLQKELNFYDITHEVVEDKAVNEIAEVNNEIQTIEAKPLVMLSESVVLDKTDFKAIEPNVLKNEAKLTELVSSDKKIGVQLPFLVKEPKTSNKVMVQLPVGIAANSGAVAPVAELNARIALKRNTQSIKHAQLGIAAYGMLSQNETNDIKLEPVLFAEASLGWENNQDKLISGHAIGIGYSLNETELMNNTRAVKLNYTVSIKKRIRVAAEALVGDGLNKVQPGIKLTFI